ncbi:MAG TPA: class I SAM-dependent methyltransferase [Terriglobia bacterium]|nr:class I SAM-dependent methyltransferase [Terriglobia bacterium]
MADRAHSSSQELTKTYNSTAAYWDSFIQRGVYGYAYARLLKKLRPQFASSPGEERLRVLDCGTGCGLLLESAVKALGYGPIELFGVDLSSTMLDRARRRLKLRGANAKLSIADIASLPFGDDEIDLVMTALTLEHAAEPVDFLREMVRVARPGANLILVTTRAYAPDLPYQILFRYKHFRTEQILAWMKQAGLRDVRRQQLAGIARLFGQAFAGRKSGGPSTKRSPLQLPFGRGRRKNEDRSPLPSGEGGPPFGFAQDKLRGG